jgi:hypothetical protein
MKNPDLLRWPCLWAGLSSLKRTFMYASFLKTSAALHLGLFDQPLENPVKSITNGLQSAERIGKRPKEGLPPTSNQPYSHG